MVTLSIQKRRVHLSYPCFKLPYSEEEHAAEYMYLLDRLQGAAKNLQKEFSQLHIWPQIRDGSNIEIILEDQLGLRSPLDKALRSLIKTQGVPNFVYQGSDYELCDEEFKPYKKITKRRFPTLFIGKDVVEF